MSEELNTVDQDALEKAIANVEAEVSTLNESVVKSAPESRMEELMAKGLAASEDEMQELRELLVPQQTTSLSDSIQKSFAGNDSLQKSIATDVTGYLQKSTTAVVESMVEISDRVEELASEDQRTQRTLAMMAKSIVAQGELLKAIAQEVQALGRSEAAAPKAVRSEATGDVVEKSFATDHAQQAAPERLNFKQSEVLDTLEDLMRDGTLAKSYSNQDVLTAITGFELGNELPMGMQEAVLKRLQSQKN